MGNCRGKMAAGPPVSALDRVASQPSAEDEFPLYRLASYRKTGELLDAYSHGGTKEIERIVREELRLFMYNDGQGRILTTNDFNTWKNSKQRQVALEMEDDAAKDPSSAEKYKFVEHEACWSLECRGSLGETLLHVLIMCNSRIHNRIAKLLVKHYPKVAVDLIEGEEFFGTSALHLALAYGNDELAQMLVQAGANVVQRATGRFFLPTDQQTSTPVKNTNYDGLAYFGEYPLAWAACFENEAMYNYLIDQGADPNMQDSFGNMVLHIVVINDKLSMYGYALRHPMKPAKNDFTNKAGLTPLTLACTLGRDNIFREMLELSCVEFWRYSNITCSAYPLNALDTILPDGRTNWKSALMIILRGQSEQHLDMLEGGVIQRLLEDKWKTFARMQFLKRLVILFQHLLVLSIAMYLRPSCSASINVEGLEGDGETSTVPPKAIACNTTLTEDTDVQAIIRYCAEVASCISGSYYVFIQQGQEILAQGLFTYLMNLIQSPAKFIFLLSNLFILLCIPFRFLKLRDLEDVLLAFAIPGNWFFLMFFAGAIRLTGPFVTMIYSMIAGDMVRFGIIYLIMLLGFSQVFYFLFKIYPPEANDYESYIGTWMSLLHMTLGSYQYSSFGDTHYHVLTRIVFVVFMVLVPILLLNMLIAMMGNTYTQVISKSEKEFVKQWANIVLSLERSISKENAKDFLDAYAINLQSPQGQEQLKGLMVIKSKAKTKARQRKGALSNWKRAGKKVITKLRETGLKGDALRAQILGGQIQVTQGGRDNDSTGTPGVGRSGLDNALSQLAWATGLELNALSNPVPGGDQSKSPVPEEAGSKLDDALQMVTWQHDIELSAKSNASNPTDEKQSSVAVIQQESQQGVENPAFTMDEEEISTVAPTTTVQAASVVSIIPQEEVKIRTVAWEENEEQPQKITTCESCRHELRTAPPLVAEETYQKESTRELPPLPETKEKKKKKKKKRKRHLEEGSEESLDKTNLLPPDASPRPGRRRRSSRKRRAEVPEVVVGVSGLTEVQCEARQTELPSLNTAQPARLIKRWSTTSIASISTLLDNPDNEDTI